MIKAEAPGRDVEMPVVKDFPREKSISEHSQTGNPMNEENALPQPLTQTVEKEDDEIAASGGAVQSSVFKQLAVIYSMLCITVFSAAVSSAIIPSYGIALGATTFLIGLISSLSGIAGICGTYILGYLADLPRYGRRLSNIIHNLGVPIVFLFIATSNTLITLYAGVVINSLLSTGVTPIAAYIADVTKPGEERTKYFAWTGAFTGLSVTFGGILSVVLLTIGWKLTQLFTFSCIGGALAFLVAIIFLKEPQVNRVRTTEINIFKVNAKAEPLKLSNISRHHWFLFAAMLTSFYSYSGPFSVISVLVLKNFDWNATQLAMLLVGAGLVFAIAQIFVNVLVRKFSHQKLSICFTFTLGFSMTLLPFLTTPVLFLPVLTISIVSISVISTTIPVQLSQETKQSRQGQIQSLSQIFQTLAGIFSPLIVGSIFDQDTGKIAYVQAGLVAILGSGILLYDLRFNKKQEPEKDRRMSREEPFLSEEQGKEQGATKDGDEGIQEADVLDAQLLQRISATSRMSTPGAM
jgi:DHA1 family multidrug resistance protein-like MFS transporter